MTDFIDRAKLEALAEQEYPTLADHEVDWEYPRSVIRSKMRDAFLAGAAAYAALLDAETTEEWGVRGTNHTGEPAVKVSNQEKAERFASPFDSVVSRRVTPWLPSEGGEKP